MIANAALEPFSKLIGRWATEGSHPMLPGQTLRGEASFEWIEGRAYILMRTRMDEPKVPEGMAIFGSDDADGACYMLYYDSRGVSRKCDTSLEHNVWKWWRNHPGFSQRYTMTLSDDGQTMVGKGELSKDDATWESDLELTYTRT